MQNDLASLNLGGVKLDPDTYMVSPFFHRIHSNGPIWGDSITREVVRSVNGSLSVRRVSRPVTFTGIPAAISSAMTGLIRWCDVITLQV